MLFGFVSYEKSLCSIYFIILQLIDMSNKRMNHMANRSGHVTPTMSPMMAPQGSAGFPMLPSYNFPPQGVTGMPRVPGMRPQQQQQQPFPGNIPASFHNVVAGGGGHASGGGLAQPAVEQTRKPEKAPPPKRAKL